MLGWSSFNLCVNNTELAVYKGIFASHDNEIWNNSFKQFGLCPIFVQIQREEKNKKAKTDFKKFG